MELGGKPEREGAMEIPELKIPALLNLKWGKERCLGF